MKISEKENMMLRYLLVKHGGCLVLKDLLYKYALGCTWAYRNKRDYEERDNIYY